MVFSRDPGRNLDTENGLVKKSAVQKTGENWGVHSYFHSYSAILGGGKLSKPLISLSWSG